MKVTARDSNPYPTLGYWGCVCDKRNRDLELLVKIKELHACFD